MCPIYVIETTILIPSVALASFVALVSGGALLVLTVYAAYD